MFKNIIISSSNIYQHASIAGKAGIAFSSVSILCSLVSAHILCLCKCCVERLMINNWNNLGGSNMR